MRRISEVQASTRSLIREEMATARDLIDRVASALRAVARDARKLTRRQRPRNTIVAKRTPDPCTISKRQTKRKTAPRAR
jgi:hypothetical protein